MKKVKIKWSNLLFNLMVLLTVVMIANINPVYAVAGAIVTGTVLGFVKESGNHMAMMAIQREIWEGDIVANLFKNNEFLQYAFNADQYVVQGKVVHIPNAGSAPDVEKNRSSLPAAVTTRTDVDITYNLDEFTSDPIRIPHADTVELSYDKRQSVTAEAQAKLREVVADSILVNWAPAAGQTIKTTGDTITAYTDAATGNRKALTVADIKSAAKKMNKDDVPQEERYALLSADMYDQLLNDLTATQYRDFSAAFDPATGILGRLYGFNIMMRSSVLIYNASYAVKAVGAAGATDDNDASLVWQKNSVERALGEVRFFEDLGNPTYYSDIYSFLLRMGGRIRRNDKKGVYALTQDSAM